MPAITRAIKGLIGSVRNSQEGLLFSYAEAAENDLQNILSSGPAGDLPECIKCGMQIYGHELRGPFAQQTRDSLSERLPCFIKSRAVPLIGDEDICRGNAAMCADHMGNGLFELLDAGMVHG